jgi:ferrochelatase
MQRVTPGQNSAVLLVAHGTVESVSDLPAFLSRIRHGRAPSQELVEEVTRRYSLIGRSPLLDVTRAQGEALARALDLPVLVGMRLSDPSVESALLEAGRAFVERLCLLPLAPFSVHVYQQAAERSARELRERGEQVPELVPVEAWGEHDTFVGAHAELIRKHAPTDASLILTAHSLPSRAIAGGDPYDTLARRCADAIGRKLDRSYHLAYQSQGADGGDWLGPDLRTTLEQLARQGQRRIALAPFGFLTEHVETLYDLDVEARAWAAELGIELTRVPAIGTHPGLIQALAEVARRALGR